MHLYVVRHGIAEPGGRGRPDGERPLTGKGRDLLAAAVRGLDILGVRITRILSSPLVRARQTAEILASGLGVPPVDIVPEIVSGAPPRAFLNALLALAEEPAVAVVGHEPDLGYLATTLLGGTGGQAPFPFRPGAVACFEVEVFPRTHQATLQWFVESTHLCRLTNRAVSPPEPPR